MKGLDMIAETRLKTKASCYRTFIVELERLKTQLNEESKYIDLLKIELAEINQINLEKQALKLYNLRNDFPNDKISKSSEGCNL